MPARIAALPAFLTATRPGSQPRAAVAVAGRQVDDEREMMRHVRVLHPWGYAGDFVLASKNGRYQERAHPAAQRLMQHEVRGQQFVSMNRVQRRRLKSMLAAVGNLWLEFDPYGEDAQGQALPYRGMDPAVLMAIILAAILEAGLPAPSYWTDSGRGLHAVWLCEALPGKAAPKVQRIMDELYGPVLNADGSVPARTVEDPDRDAQEVRLAGMWRVFRDAGLDRQTKDPSRVLRLWGSFNVKAGRLCRRLWPAAIEDIQHCRVDQIADAVLPLTNAAYRDRMAEKAEGAPIEAPSNAKPRRARSANPRAGKMAAWDRKLSDLLRLREHRGRIAVGQRHLWTFLTANAYAQAKGGDPAMWAELLAPLAGLTVAQALDCLGSLGRRQKRREAGETVQHGGVAWNPLFNYSGAKLADALGVTVEEADAAGLCIVRPGKGQAVPPIERKAQKRIRDGAIPQPARADAKLQAGRLGLEMQAQGSTKSKAIEAVRAATGRGRTWAIEAMQLAASNTAEVTVAATPVDQPRKVRKSGIEAVRFSGRLIGGIAPPTPPAPSEPEVSAAAAPQVPADEPVRVRRYSPFFIECRTSTAHWTVLTVGTGRMAFEVREDMPLDAPDLVPEGGYGSPLTSGLDAATDARFAAVQADLHREATQGRRRASRVSAARSPARRAVVVPLDVTAAAEAYRLASGR